MTFQDLADAQFVVRSLQQLGMVMTDSSIGGAGARPAMSSGMHNVAAVPAPQIRPSGYSGQGDYSTPLGGHVAQERPWTSSAASPTALSGSIPGAFPHQALRPQTAVTPSILSSPTLSPNRSPAPSEYTSRTLSPNHLGYSNLFEDNRTPSEIVAPNIPPKRPLPAGFPLRSSARQDEAQEPPPSQGPTTRSKSNSVNKTAAQPLRKASQRPTANAAAQRASKAVPTRQNLDLDNIPRLDPPSKRRKATHHGTGPAIPQAASATPVFSPSAAELATYTGVPPAYPSASATNPFPTASIPLTSEQRTALDAHGGFLTRPTPKLFSRTGNHRDDNGNDGSGAVAGAVVLARYAAQSAEARQAALNKLIVENLQNADFRTLCEDVEVCWRRVVLDA